VLEQAFLHQVLKQQLIFAFDYSFEELDYPEVEEFGSVFG
jgi:hypothetical protein